MVVRAARAAVAALGVGCESTQSKSAKLEANSKGAIDEGKGLVIKKENPDVKVLADLHAQGQERRGRDRPPTERRQAAAANLPIAVRLADKSGKAVYTNTQPGLETALAHIAFLQPGQELFWVNDQVVSTGRPAQAKTMVGDSKPVTGAAPKIEITGAHLRNDPVSGISVAGRVVNHSQILQRRLPVFCVARKGDAVVAAGRAILEKVKPGRSAPFTVFFIGNPRDARLTVTPLPSTLKGTPS